MTAMQSVASALDGVASWRSEQDDLRKAEMAALDEKIATLRSQIAEIESQIADAESARDALQHTDSVQAVVARSYGAIFSALLGQANELDARADAVETAKSAREKAVLEGLASSDLAPQVEEYNQFKTQVEPTLTALPESYREALVEHHLGIVARIKTHLAGQLASPVAVDAPALELEVVYGIDAPSGTPELLICVLPLRDVTFTDWRNRPEGLGTHVGARVVQAVYEATNKAGLSGAQAVFGGHQGLLALELDLEGVGKDFDKTLAERLDAVLSGAPELRAAAVSVRCRKVLFDYLLPPEIDETEA